MQAFCLRSFLFSILLLFVDFAGAEDVVINANDPNLSSSPVWTTSTICPKSHYLNRPGDTVVVRFVGTRITINFESTDMQRTSQMLALVSINNTYVAIVDTAHESKCLPIPWTSGGLPRGRHTLRVTQMNNSDHVYIRSFSFTRIVSDTPKEELKCYGLPYGGLGFLSHILTLYSLLCLIHRRKAYFPWSSIIPRNYTAIDMMIIVITFVATSTLTIVTMARCNNHWQYILLAVEGFCLSIAISAISLSSTLNTSDDTHTAVSYLMTLFAFLGGVVGGVGYISLIVQNWHNKNVRIAFGSIFGGAFGLGFVLGVISVCIGEFPDLLSYVVFLHLFGVSMSDWVLGAIAGDISGIPHGKIAILVWFYFAVRRLPLGIS